MKLKSLSPHAERHAPARQRPPAAALALATLVSLLALAIPGGAAAAAPTTPTGLSVSNVTKTSFVLSWNASSADGGSPFYRILWLESSRLTQTPPPWPDGTPHQVTQSTSTTIQNLGCGRTYLVGISAWDSAGVESGTATVLVPTAACFDSSPPTAPAQITQIASTETSATLTWSPSSDDFGVAGYRLYIGGLEVGQTPDTTYTFAGLTCGTSTSIAIEAYDAAGNRSSQTPFVISTSACTTPPPPPPPPPPKPGDTSHPTTPGDLRVTSSTESSVSLAWSASTDNVGVVGYGVYRDGVPQGETAQTNYTLAGLQCGTSMTVGVDAYDAAGNRSGQATVIVSTRPCTDTTPPSHPSNLVRTAATQTSISIRWSPANDNVGVVGYGIYRDGARVAQTSTTDYTLTGLTCGRGYTIGVDAYDASGNRSLVYTALMATSPCGDSQPPSAPTNLVTTNVTQTSLTLSWTASTDDVGVAGYDVFANGTKVGGSTAATSNTVAGLTCGTAYTLGVEAFDAAGNRSSRATRSVTMAACASAPGATVFLSPSGRDSNPCTQAAPCATFDRAYHVAAAGATVDVAGGVYPMTDSGANTVRITRDSKASSDDVVFRCTEGSNVDFDAANFTIVADHITFKGSCFRFRSLWTGQSGDTGPDSDDLTFDGVKMSNFQLIGSSNITIRNSEIGPNVACYAPDYPVDSARCQNNAATGEAWYYSNGQCNCGVYEPKIQQNVGGWPSTNIVLEGNWIHDQQTRASSTNVGSAQLHNGGLLIEEVCDCPLVIRGNRWERNVTYDIQGDPSPRGVTVENNWFASSTNTLDQGAAKQYGFKVLDITLRSSGQTTLSDWLIRFNSFETGLRLGDGSSWQSFSNVRVVANIFGDGYCQSGRGTWSYNVFVGAVCGTGSLSIPSLPFVSTGFPMDFHLTGGPAVNFVGASVSDSSLGNDIDGDSRPEGPARDAGADEAG